jgi:hypothetical protein
MESLSAVLSILSAMITPAILILASGSLSLTTSQRLSRSIDRTRKISNELKEIAKGIKMVSEEEKNVLLDQISKSAKRAILMQRAMTFLYVALSFFIATSLLIGILDILDLEFPWITIILAMIGALFLFSASITLIFESKLALTAVNKEMHFALKLNKLIFEDIAERDRE